MFNVSDALYLISTTAAHVDDNITANWTNSTVNASLENNSGNDNPYDKRLETYIVPILFFFIFVIGVLGNGTLILIFIRNKNMRNVPNTYIFSLAVGDILVILICVPFTSTIYTIESWPYGEIICKLSEFLKDISIGVSVFTLTALSADRCFAIVDPMRKHIGRRATTITLITTIGIWILAILFALPAAILSHIMLYKSKGSYIKICYPFPEYLGKTYKKVMVMLKFLCYYAIPLLIIAFFYALMAYHLLMSTRNMPGEAQEQSKQVKARKKVAKMVLSFVVIFAICFFPYHVFMLWFYYYPNAEEEYDVVWHAFRIVGFCFGFINSCINPIALYCVSGTFRKHFNRYLFCCLGQRFKRDSRHRSTMESSHTLMNFNSTIRRHDDITMTSIMHMDKT